MFPSDAPTCHACGAPAVYQWTRVATEAEAAERSADVARLQGRMLTDNEIEQRYGPALAVVTGCAEHHLGDDPEEADSGADRRALLHETDCAGHGACACRG